MTGLFCPGQGSQFVGMGRDLARQFPVARATFDEADSILGFSLSDLCWNGPEAELTLTKNAQPAILTHSIAVWRVLEEHRPVEFAIGAGHSLGEFSALTIAGAISFADALPLVRRRGELMHEAGERRPGTMAAILGLDDAIADEVCRRASDEVGAVAVPANFNSPGQLVISGDEAGVRRAGEIALESGARKVIPLAVSGAFHSPLMSDAAHCLDIALAATRFENPRFPVVSNVTAAPIDDGATARSLLLEQLTAPVRWTDSVRRMVCAGVDGFLELGPGNVLTGLLRRIDRSVPARPLGSPGEIQAFIGEG